MSTGRRESSDLSLALDIGAIASVPVVLVALQTLSWGVRQKLAFSVADPTLLSAFTAHFVHLSFGHLLTNLLAYAVVVLPAYALSLVANQRTLFRVTFVGVLASVPPALSLSNLVFEQAYIGLGFSGIVMALVGVLAVILAHFLERQSGLAHTKHTGPILFFTTITIAAAALRTGRMGMVVAGGAGVLLAGYVVAAVRGLRIREGERVVSWSGVDDIALAGALVCVTIPIAVFQTPSGDISSLLSQYTHLLGYCLGFIAAFVVATTCEFR